jgi:hypothetical protein
VEETKFRPHHIFCERFLKLEFADRGEEFGWVSQKRSDIIERWDDAVVEVIEGVDEVCRVCSHCQDEHCQSPGGDEQAVRKWDGILLKNLGIEYGEKRTSKEWRALMDQKAPLNFCVTRCPYRSTCTVFQLR